MECPICTNAEAAELSDFQRDVYRITCPLCGQFEISREAKINLRNLDSSLRWKISAWRHEFRPPIFSAADLERAIACQAPSLSHRVNRMLRWLSAHYPPGTSFSPDGLLYQAQIQTHVGLGGMGRLEAMSVPCPLVPIGWNASPDGMKFMLTEVLCNEMNLLITDGLLYQVGPKGLLHLEGRSDAISTTGFCAMWFSPNVLQLWTDVIEPAIRSAGYDPLRMDKAEFNDRIDDEIMASIRSAKFVVSDFSGHRGGVYYEAGFAHGLGLPVIFMCRESDMKELHFDIRQYNCIEWSPYKLEEARDRLKNRILATLGQGPLKLQ